MRLDRRFLPQVFSTNFVICGVASVGLAVAAALPASAAERTRQIEEVVVTAEKVEATVSDTSISITAFSDEMIDEFGLQSADEMVDFIPATTRDAYDIRIRGVGRNFRALGGDPGVATYYNGVFSPDFGIAASENGLWDLSRIEVLRGPQGTLYGRNAVGGALNYLTNDPTYDWTGKVRTQFGNFNTQEYYGVVSGPLIEDKVAFRLLGITRQRDPGTDGLSGTSGANSVDDRNVSLSLTWDITENISFKTRGNDRLSNRIINSATLISEGPTPVRGIRSTNVFATGLRPVASTDPGAMTFIDPADGSSVFGAYVRPGVDPSATHLPNGAFGQTETAALMANATTDDPNNLSITDDGGTGACEFPYTRRDCQHEYFGHKSNQTDLTWDINDNVQLKYIFGHTDFSYTFNIDIDYSLADYSKYRTTVDEDVQNKSHEIQLFWSVGDNWTATSGAFWYDEIRKQDYSLTDSTSRYTDPAVYGVLDVPFAFLGGASIMDFLAPLPHQRLYDAPLGTVTSGRWEGDIRGDWYHHKNTSKNNAVAVYSQGTYTFNEEWAIVLGLRWAEDTKAVEEVRTGYLEICGTDGCGFLDPILGGILGTPIGGPSGITTLAALNMLMGSGSYSLNPADPLTPTCALLDSGDCAVPIRLQGVPISYTGTIAGEDKWSDVNFRVNLDWTPNDNTLMYFSVTTGYRAGGFSLGVVNARRTDPDTGLQLPAAYDKEEVISYEIGYKGQLLDNTLSLNASAYMYQYDNYQDRVDGFDPETGTYADVVSNAPKAVNSGFEVEALWYPTDALTLGGNYSYTKTKYDADYLTTVTDDPSLPTELFGDETTRPDLFLVNQNGSQLKKIPEQKATIWGSYLFPTSVGDITFRANYSYTGDYFDAGFERELDRVPERTQLNMSLGWVDVNRHWSVRAFVDNVTDERNIRDITTASNTGNWRLTGAILYPRFFGIDVTYDFTPN